MTAVIELLDKLYCFISNRFAVRKVSEEWGVIQAAKELQLRDYFAYELRNNGNITAVINGTLLVRPNTTFSNSNWEGYTFNDNARITFDDSNSFGFNTTGTSKRVEYIVKKLG